MIITRQLGFHIFKFSLHIQIVRNGTVNLRFKLKGYAMDNKASQIVVCDSGNIFQGT
jgi:hypothetical protein